MTERFYIKRLKQMVHKYGENLCGHCPLQKNFRINYLYIKKVPGENGCIICRELAGIEPADDWTLPCPCPAMKNRLQNPYKEALKIIKKWEKKNGVVNI